MGDRARWQAPIARDPNRGPRQDDERYHRPAILCRSDVALILGGAAWFVPALCAAMSYWGGAAHRALWYDLAFITGPVLAVVSLIVAAPNREHIASRLATILSVTIIVLTIAALIAEPR